MIPLFFTNSTTVVNTAIMAAAVTSKGARDIDRELGITDKANAADQKYQISQRATQAKARKTVFYLNIDHIPLVL